MHEVTPAHQLLPPNGLQKSISIGLPLIEIQIDNATPEFQQLFKPSCYSDKYSNTNRRPFLKSQRKLQQNHRPPPPWDSRGKDWSNHLDLVRQFLGNNEARPIMQAPTHRPTQFFGGLPIPYRDKRGNYH